MTRFDRPSALSIRAPSMPESMIVEPCTLSLVSSASPAMARLDQALASHPLQQAFLHRACLEAVRRQAAVDGELIDPWHLAVVLEGLRPAWTPVEAALFAVNQIDHARNSWQPSSVSWKRRAIKLRLPHVHTNLLIRPNRGAPPGPAGV
jgi:hypothetical protein